MVDKLRSDALDAIDVAIKAADPFGQTLVMLRARQDQIKRAQQVHILAAGKAALAMARAALQIVEPQKRGTVLVVTNYENAAALDGATVLGANHPLPDAAGEQAARKIEQAAQAAQKDELVICLISGGASALLPAPIDGVTLHEKIATTDLLLKSGVDITAINSVRKALSRLKGGGLARAIAPADGFALILSDVPGDDLSTIASGPTVPGSPSVSHAASIVQQATIFDQLPASVQQALNGSNQASDIDPVGFDNVLIGSNALSVQAMKTHLVDCGYRVHVLSDWLEGDATQAARQFLKAGQNAPNGQVAIIAGGETAVQVTGSGLGGRNQHMALTFALLAKGALNRHHVFISAGTDGRDGPTDAAGGIADDQLVARAEAAHIDLAAYLANDDSYHGLKTVDGLLVTGATGTNVADVQILLLD